MSDIKIIREPSVYLVGRQDTNDAEIDRFLADHQVETWLTDTEVAGEKLAEIAGRTCYMSFAKPRPGGNHAYLNHILEVGHGSVAEHAVWNFVFTGVSRSLTHELIRHRHFSYSQLSQRYVDESVAEYVEPDIIAEDPELHAIWLEAVEHSHKAYVRLAEGLAAKIRNRKVMEYLHSPAAAGIMACNPSNLEPDLQTKTAIRKEARQAARSVLPNATETKIFVTANARALRHFLELRGSRHAEPEIRKLAVAVLKIMQAEAPNLFGDYQLVPLADGTREITTTYRKV